MGSANSYLLTRASLGSAQSAHVWMIGTLNGRTWGAVQAMAVALAVLLPLTALLGRRLRMLELGDELAGALGVPVGRVRFGLALLGVGLCGMAVASAGPVPFVALAALLARSPGVSLVAVGAALLSAAHLLSGQFSVVAAWWGEHVGGPVLVDGDQAGSQLPVDVTTAVLGGAYLTWVPFRGRGAGRAEKRDALCDAWDAGRRVPGVHGECRRPWGWPDLGSPGSAQSRGTPTGSGQRAFSLSCRATSRSLMFLSCE